MKNTNQIRGRYADVSELRPDLTAVEHPHVGDRVTRMMIAVLATSNDDKHAALTAVLDRCLGPVKFLIALLLLASAAPARALEFRENPDRFPSVGLHVDNLSLGGARTETVVNSAGREVPFTHSDETESGWKGGADVRLPVTQSLTFTLAYDHVETDDYFTRHNEMGGDVYKEHKGMSGYSYGLGVRLYLNK